MAGPSPNTYTMAEAQVYSTFDALASTSPMASLGTCLLLDELVDQYGANEVARHLVAMDLDVFYGGNACGACLQLRYPATDQSMILTVFDWHNGRGTHDLGVPLVVAQELKQTSAAAEAFLPFEVEWNFVPCNNDQNKNLLYRFSDDATLENTPSLKLTNAPYGIQNVQMQRYGLWYDLVRMVGNSAYWVLPQGQQVLPMSIRVTSFTNELLEFVISEIEGSSVLKDAGVQFTGTCVRTTTTTAITAPPSKNNDNDLDDTSSNSNNANNNGGAVETSVPASSIYNNNDGSNAASVVVRYSAASWLVTMAMIILWSV